MVTLVAAAFIPWFAVFAAEPPSGCTAGRTLAELDASLGTAEGAFAKRKKDQVLGSTKDAEMILPCLSEEIGVPLSARYHRVEGLSAFLEGNDARSTLFFSSARALDPTYVLPGIPAGHPLEKLYQTASPNAVLEPLPPPGEGRVQLDGRPSLDRPTTRPTIFQYVDSGGTVRTTSLLEPGSANPIYPLAAPPEQKSSRWLLGAAFVSAAASAGLYGGAWATRSAYDNTALIPENEDQLNRLYETNHALTVSSAVAALIGGGAAALTVALR